MGRPSRQSIYCLATDFCHRKGEEKTAVNIYQAMTYDIHKKSNTVPTWNEKNLLGVLMKKDNM